MAQSVDAPRKEIPVEHRQVTDYLSSDDWEKRLAVARQRRAEVLAQRRQAEAPPSAPAAAEPVEAAGTPSLAATAPSVASVRPSGLAVAPPVATAGLEPAAAARSSDADATSPAVTAPTVLAPSRLPRAAALLVLAAVGVAVAVPLLAPHGDGRTAPQAARDETPPPASLAPVPRAEVGLEAAVPEVSGLGAAPSDEAAPAPRLPGASPVAVAQRPEAPRGSVPDAPAVQPAGPVAPPPAVAVGPSPAPRADAPVALGPADAAPVVPGDPGRLTSLEADAAPGALPAPVAPRTGSAPADLTDPAPEPLTLPQEVQTVAARLAAPHVLPPAAAADSALARPPAIADAARYSVRLHAADPEAGTAAIAALGFAPPTGDASPFAPNETLVVYFDPADAAAARLLAEALGGTVEDLAGLTPRPPPGTLEVYLAD
jgi:hypothetical protein